MSADLASTKPTSSQSTNLTPASLNADILNAQTGTAAAREAQSIDDIGSDYKYGFSDKEDYVFKSGRGLTREIVVKISEMKKEPEWMLKFRLRALDIFLKKPMPTWGNCGLLNDIDFDNIYYYIKPSGGTEKSWDEVPEGIKNTFDRLGIPEAERKFLAGVTAQYESEVVYHSIREDLEKEGVIFLDMDSALREHPEIVREHFATVIPAADNKFSALNSAVWSGGSFIWVPAGVKVEIPLQAYFRINAENMGQFERTLIIAEPGSFVHYIEGCTAPTYSTDSLHSAVVELIAKPGAHIRYTTIQNWSKNVYNLVTKRAVAHEDAKVEWVDGNLGSKLTMKYPAIYLMGPRAHGEVLSIAFAGEDQHQDAGAKIIHAAPDTTSLIVSKSISKKGGRTSYRGLIKVHPHATGVKSSVKCDALLMDDQSRSDTYPTMEIDEKDVNIEHEATVSKVGEEQLFYLMSRGLSQDEATAMIVNGFFEPFTKELPLEYAVELNRLIQLEMEGSVG
jgi:Fe-S cluster assembly protein SufB